MTKPGFANLVLEIVRAIPAGSVTTYGRIATLAGRARAARAVGNILRGSGGADVPWHRVINASGAISGGGSHGRAMLQRSLLQAEGARFDRSGALPLDELLWQPPAELVLRWADLASRSGVDDG